MIFTVCFEWLVYATFEEDARYICNNIDRDETDYGFFDLYT